MAIAPHGEDVLREHRRQQNRRSLERRHKDGHERQGEHAEPEKAPLGHAEEDHRHNGEEVEQWVSYQGRFTHSREELIGIKA